MKIKLRKRTRRLLALILALLVAWLVALWAIPAAYAERGYRAVGGEWLLVTVTGGAVYGALAPRAKKRHSAKQARYILAAETFSGLSKEARA